MSTASPTVSRTPPANPVSVVVDTSHSPHARLRPVAVNRVTLEDAFWAPRRATNRAVTLPEQFQHLQDTGRLDNFRRVIERWDTPFQGIYFNDSDVYKWLEAAAWTLADGPDEELSRMADEVIALIEGAQDGSGYLNTYFSLERKGERWSNLKDKHELYCAGHLIQAAVAHHRATGSERLLNVARRLADHIKQTFGPASEGKLELTDGHEEIELALVELARDTKEPAYLEQARFFVDVRGERRLGADEANTTYNSGYYQDREPLREMSRVEGHAVRMMYYAAGATDVYLETGDPALLTTLHRLWTHMTGRQMYVSGGLGSRYEGEAFGEDFELPNARAYTETCAAIGSVMWNGRLLAAGGEGRYADLLEHTLYNAVLPGWSLSGTAYFYQNPLADEGKHRRRPWFGCACCPPNVARLVAQLPGLFYSISEERGGPAVWVHLYAEGRASLPVGNRELTLRQRTAYPWDGAVELEIGDIAPDVSAEFALVLRVPGWCEEGAAIFVNGESASVQLEPGTYVRLERRWRAGDTVRLELPMPVRRLAAHPRVAEDSGRVALMRGPILYCLEGVDHPDIPLDDLELTGAALTARREPGLLGGAVVLEGEARLQPLGEGWSGLYRSEPAEGGTGGPAVPVRAVPYHLWANREPGPMRVWVRAG